MLCACVCIYIIYIYIDRHRPKYIIRFYTFNPHNSLIIISIYKRWSTLPSVTQPIPAATTSRPGSKPPTPPPEPVTAQCLVPPFTVDYAAFIISTNREWCRDTTSLSVLPRSHPLPWIYWWAFFYKITTFKRPYNQNGTHHHLGKDKNLSFPDLLIPFVGKMLKKISSLTEKQNNTAFFLGLETPSRRQPETGR